MSVEVQIRTDALIAIVTRTLRQALRISCLPFTPGFSIDRIDILDTGVTLGQVGNAVEIRIPANVYVVTDADLFGRPNDTPLGALNPSGTITFPVRFEVETANEPSSGGTGTERQTYLRLTPQRPDFGALESRLGPLADRIWQTISDSVPSPRQRITGLLRTLQAGNLDQVSVVSGNGIIAVRVSSQCASERPVRRRPISR